MLPEVSARRLLRRVGEHGTSVQCVEEVVDMAFDYESDPWSSDEWDQQDDSDVVELDYLRNDYGDDEEEW